MNLKNTITEENLKKALQGEALAHLKYQFYKSKISNVSKEFEEIFDEVIHNEKEHAKIWFKVLHGGEIPSDFENLTDAMKGEDYEYTEMYPEFARIAREEGFDDIADLFDGIGHIEGQHRDKFSEMFDCLQKQKLFKDENKVYFKCKNCGHVYFGKEAPMECPICKHPQKYFVRD